MTEQYYCYDELIPGDSLALNEKIKNRLFRYIFTRPDHKDWALNLFNSLEGTHYTNPDDLNLCILQNSIYMDIQNKFSVFICGWDISFPDERSAIIPGIPFFLLGDYSSWLEDLLFDDDRPVLTELPFPGFHALYFSKEKTVEKMTLKLSDLYENKEKDEVPMLELKVTAHNISGYENGKNSCRQLYEYQWFAETFHKLCDQGYIAEEASEEAIDQMPDDFTIKELFMLYRDEVTDMWLFEYDEKKHMEMVQRDYEARGEVIRTIKLVRRKMDKGRSFEQACSDLDLTEDEIEEIKPSFEMMN